MNKRIFRILFLFFLLAFLSTSALAQQQTGTIRGIITDPDGNPLPGVTVSVTSEAIMGPQTYVSTETGAFRFPALPPGTYKLTAEMTGFKTFVRENLIVRVGMTVTVDFTMEIATVEEEVTVTAASPTVDVQSTKIAVIMDGALLKNLPLARDLYDIMTAAPGAISEGMTYRRTYAIHGSTVRSNTTSFDGVNMNDPVVMYTITNINFDVMDEVESITAGHPASVGFTDGAYVNIVTKSGGNKFSGGAVAYFTNQDMAQHLWTDEQVTALGVAKPEVSKSWIDGSLTFGGPVMVDKLWFFTNGRYIKQERVTNFIGPYTDVLGYTHNPYNWTHQEQMGFIKLTGQLGSKIKLMGMFNYTGIYRPMYEEPGSRVCFIRTRVWDHETGYTGNAILNYIFDQNTFVDLRFGLVRRWFPIPMQPGEAQDWPRVYDRGSLYGYITNARFNETYLRKRWQTGAYFTRFQDNLLGGNHEFKGGVEYENTYGDWDWYRKDNMIWYIDSTNSNHMYYDGSAGRVYFYICGPESGSNRIIDRGGRIGAYIQDSATFADRLTVNVGIRFDRSWGWKPAVNKAQAGNPTSVWVGENVVRPYVIANYGANFPEGINPWAAGTSPEWKDIISWNEFSPRFGITYDPFGQGKTAIKFSFNRYTEYLMLQYFSTLHPFYPRSFRLTWTDTNDDWYPNIGDTFVVYPADYRGMDPEFAKQRLDPEMKSPLTDELTFGVWHELFKNFSLGLNFIYKHKKNIAEDVLYAPDLDAYWYHIDQPTAQRYWIPFTTTVPGTDNYPSRDVTLYYFTNDAPGTFYRFTNVPELTRKYWAVELIFNKRMSDGWQFGGSIVYSKAYGNIGGWYDQSWGWSGGADNPNAFVNTYGRINTDRPLQIKLYGTAQLPLRIFLSAFYQYQDGSPWARYASIRPPSSWCTAHNVYRQYLGVNIETEGSRRNRAWNQLDMRLEKEFALGNFGRLGAYIDVTNVLGWSGVGIGLDDVYRWDPVAEGPNQTGTKSLETTYKVISSVSGTREAKFSLRFSF